MSRGARSIISHARTMTTLQNIPKSCSFTEALTPDEAIKTKAVAYENEQDIIRTPRILQVGSYSWSLPEIRKEYMYLTSSPQALADLGLDASEIDNEEYRQIVSGQVYQDPKFEERGFPFPYSQAYAGWQFGQFAAQLGDGRVHNLFEVPKNTTTLSPTFKNNRKKFEVQLKGSGKTPFSRFADGKAVLRSSIREYIISEHLNAIGIPTTRALALTFLPKTFAQRYGAERCAIVARFAESWVRLGSFDLFRWRHDVVGVRKLCQYVIDVLFTMDDGAKFPFLEETLKARSDFFDSAKSLLGELTDFDKMYYEIIIRNAETTAMWQAYGFLNGVLNTDNTSVLGLSMDFGPFAIMDKLDTKFTPNSEDHLLRYSYANTPTSIWWNLTRLGEDIAHLIGAGTKMIDDESLIRGSYTDEIEENIIKRATKIIEVGGEIYQYAFTKKYVETFFRRLGLPQSLVTVNAPDQQNDDLIAPLITMLEKVQCDFNKFFLSLQNAKVGSAHFDVNAFAESILLKNVSPLQNYDTEEVKKSIKDWITKFQQYVSKEGLDEESSARTNPQFLPRSWILNEVIERTQDTKGEDLSYLHKLEKMAFNPFDPSKWGDELKEVEEKWVQQGDVDEEYSMIQCSCSS